MNKARLSGAVLAALLTATIPGTALADGGRGSEKHDTLTIAVTGDIPYGDAQIAGYPLVIDEINADPDVDLVLHLGDIKSGSSQCTDQYFADVKAQFDRVEDPLIYTPGDNEWTDCHRTNNGGYDPYERLAAIRSTFFPRAGRTLGQRPMEVSSQARIGFVENVSFERNDVRFAAIHAVGSNNGLVPWTGATAPNAQQIEEVAARNAADVALIKDTFRKASKDRAKGVVLFMQADMFDPFDTTYDPANWSGLKPIVEAMAEGASHFRGPVLLLNGDSHGYVVNKPLAAGSPWLAVYGVKPVTNLTRLTIEGSTGVDEWTKLTVDKESRSNVFSSVQVPFAH